MKPSLDTILTEALIWHHVTPAGWEDIRHTRKLTAVRVMQLVALIAYECGYSHAKIATFLNRDRSTIIHHINTLRADCFHYVGTRRMVDAVRYSVMNTLQMHSHTTYGWLARSNTGLLTFSFAAPEKQGGYWFADRNKVYEDQGAFPQVTYETGPVRVRIETTIIEDNEEM